MVKVQKTKWTMNQHMQTVSGISQFYIVIYTVHKYVKISWTSECLVDQSALGLSISQSAIESRNDTNSLMVLAILIKSSSGLLESSVSLLEGGS